MIALPTQRLLIAGLGLLSLFLGLSCNTTKPLTEEPVITSGVRSAEDHLDALVREQVQADWMNASAQINFATESTSIGGTASIKMKKDEAIVMSVKKFGFEVARAMVTPDSLFILDRLNNEYAAEPLSYIEDRFKLPADLTMLQQLLLGNPVFLTTSNPSVELDNGSLLWTAENSDERNSFTFMMPDYRLENMEVQQNNGSRNLNIQLADYQDAGANRDFSYLRTIAINSKETGAAQVELKFTKVEINVPTTINFSIPPRYQRSKR